MLLIGWFAAVIMIAVLIFVAGGNLWSFVDLPGVLFDFIPLLFVIAGGFRKSALFGFKAALSFKNTQPDKLELAKAVRLFHYLYKATIITGILGSLIGVIILMSVDVKKFTVNDILSGNASNLVTVVYGLVLGFFVYYPIELKLRFLFDEASVKKGKIGE